MLIAFDDLFARYHVRPTGVLHLGANTGQEAEVYHRHGIDRVIWVEALPSVYDALVANVARYPSNLTLCACVSDQDDQEVTFNVSSNHGQSSSFLDFGTHKTEHPTVRWINHIKMKTTRVDSLLFGGWGDIIVSEGGWFLNVDLQGAELLALKGMGDLLWGFSHAYIEVNERELYKGCPLVGEIDHHLARFGFVGMETKMTGNGWGDKFYQRFAVKGKL